MVSIQRQVDWSHPIGTYTELGLEMACSWARFFLFNAGDSLSILKRETKNKTKF